MDLVRADGLAAIATATDAIVRLPARLHGADGVKGLLPVVARVNAGEDRCGDEQGDEDVE